MARGWRRVTFHVATIRRRIHAKEATHCGPVITGRNRLGSSGIRNWEGCGDCRWGVRRASTPLGVETTKGGGGVRGGGFVRLEGPGWVSYKGVIRVWHAKATKLLSRVLNEIRRTLLVHITTRRDATQCWLTLPADRFGMKMVRPVSHPHTAHRSAQDEPWVKVGRKEKNGENWGEGREGEEENN
jgi:hypothetical protein